jgi:diguanylate cyclase (GGDEF)-like protein
MKSLQATKGMWINMKQQHHISIIYGILLTLGLLLVISALLFIPVNTYYESEKAAKVELVPYAVERPSEDVRIFRFHNIDWNANGSCLYFRSSHQQVKIVADDEIVFERNLVSTIFGHTTGFAKEFIEIPTGTKEVTITLTACYPSVRDSVMTFYQGYAPLILKEIFQEEGFPAIVSLVNLCIGVLMFFYGFIARKRSSIGLSMTYIGVLCLLLSVWSLMDNGIVSLLIDNRPACSFICYTCLLLSGAAFILFICDYLQTEDKYLHIILLMINILNILLTFQCQLFGIVDMKEILITTHISMVLALLYLPYSIVQRIRKHGMSRRVWVAVCSIGAMFPTLGYSLYLYYNGAHNVDGYGNLCFFLFILIFAIDVALSMMKDIEAGREAAIYRELAEKDLLTGCYNRNAYRNDTNNCADLKDVLLVTCDLNNLKQCNDTLGHAYGDRYIIDSAMILKTVFSHYGKVYRIGGDEFCVIIPNRHKCNIKRLLANLLEEERIYNTASQMINMQIACGYAQFDSNSDTNLEDIRIRADEQMYENKRELKKNQEIR